MTCWAAAHSKCEGGISREHLISPGVLGAGAVNVQGFDWCQGREIRVGVGSLVSKVLCRKHNSVLESADRAGIAAIRIFEGSLRSTGRIDGVMFERWLLKTAINVTYEGSLRIGMGMTDSEPGIPSPYLLAVVFGDLDFTHKMGAYFLFPRCSFEYRAGEISIVPIHKNGEVGGFLFSLRGIFVLLSLCPGHDPPPLQELGIEVATHLAGVKPMYRCGSIIVSNSEGSEDRISFDW